MVSRENLLTIAFVLLALPAAYGVQLHRLSLGVDDRTTATVAFAAILVVVVLVPQVLVRRLEIGAE